MKKFNLPGEDFRVHRSEYLHPELQTLPSFEMVSKDVLLSRAGRIVRLRHYRTAKIQQIQKNG